VAVRRLPFELRVRPDGRVQSIGFDDFAGQLTFPFSAHPKVHAPSGDLLFHGYTHDANGPSKWWGRLTSTPAPSTDRSSAASFAAESAGSGAASAGDERRVELAYRVHLPPERAKGLAHDIAITQSAVVLFGPRLAIELGSAASCWCSRPMLTSHAHVPCSRPMLTSHAHVPCSILRSSRHVHHRQDGGHALWYVWLV
jgi:hypothetical protein